MMRWVRGGVLVSMLAAHPVWAHVGSADNFVQTAAGPYPVVISTHPPGVFPGSMNVDLRFLPGATVHRARIGVDGEPPVSLRVKADGTGTSSVWLPGSDAHTLHVSVEGDGGPAALDVSLPGWTLHAPASRRTLNAANMLWVAAFLLYIGCILVLAGGKQRKRNMKIAAALIGIAFVVAASTWPIRPRPAGKTSLRAEAQPDGRLTLRLSNPGEHFDDLTLNAGKPMDLFAVREPIHDVFVHLHPQPVGDGAFGTQWPAVPPGTYTLFADMVHLPAGHPASEARTESVTATAQMPLVSETQTADPDDTFTVVAAAQNGAGIARLPDGYVMSLAVDGRLDAKYTHLMTLSLLDPQGKPVADPALYLRSPAQVVVVGHDDSVLVHLHSGGTLPQLEGSGPLPAPSGTTTVPFGFPARGAYRVFAQMKHGHKVETAAFDLDVE